jgi:hypothetical protein
LRKRYNRGRAPNTAIERRIKVERELYIIQQKGAITAHSESQANRIKGMGEKYGLNLRTKKATNGWMVTKNKKKTP